mmetsp:Transcript_60183/g.130527  ORF Transcript_60183/g.130527 Transcript_60183/m.130527 type:complete len:136 (+) Transcript_60183:954-1361(+)
MFYRIDLSMDNHIQFEEFIPFFRRLDPKSDDKKLAVKFKKIDIDGNGSLEYNEFEKFIGPILNSYINKELVRRKLIDEKLLSDDEIKSRADIQANINKASLTINGQDWKKEEEDAQFNSIEHKDQQVKNKLLNNN